MKSNLEIASEVINGGWGNGEDRIRRLTQAGYNYNVIQKLVNDILSGYVPVDETPIEESKEDEELLVINVDLKKYKGVALYIEV